MATIFAEVAPLSNTQPPAVRPDPFQGELTPFEVKKAFRLFTASYPRFLPCAASSLVLATAYVLTESYAVLAAFGFLSNLCGVWAAGRALGCLRDDTPGHFLLRVLSHVFQLLLLGVAAFAAALPGQLFTQGLACEYPTLSPAAIFFILLVLSGGPVLLVVSKLWPLNAIAFVAASAELRRPHSGLRLAWRLTGEQKATPLATSVVLRYWVGFLGTYIVFMSLFEAGYPAASVVSALFGTLCMPFLHLVLVERALCLYKSWLGPPPEAAMNPEILTENAWKEPSPRSTSQSAPRGIEAPPHELQ